MQLTSVACNRLSLIVCCASWQQTHLNKVNFIKQFWQINSSTLPLTRQGRRGGRREGTSTRLTWHVAQLQMSTHSNSNGNNNLQLQLQTHLKFKFVIFFPPTFNELFGQEDRTRNNWSGHWPSALFACCASCCCCQLPVLLLCANSGTAGNASSLFDCHVDAHQADSFSKAIHSHCTHSNTALTTN